MGNGESVVKVEVAYALPEQQTVIALEVAEGSTVQLAIEQSGILAKHAELDLQVNSVGVYGKAAKLDALVRDGDRVEIYRPIVADPKAARKKKAAKAKPTKAAEGIKPIESSAAAEKE